MNLREYNQSVDLHSDNIYRFVLKNIRDEERSRDIVQDCYEKLWITRENVKTENVKSYLFTTAYHTMIDIIRREKKLLSTENLNDAARSHDEHYSDLSEVLNHAIMKLPAIQRSVILLRDYEGYSYKEIGEITGLSEAQVKVYIYRGRIFLKSYLVKMDLVL